MNLIGLAGLAHVGKDTIANFIAEDHGSMTHWFAQPIRDGLKAMFGLTDSDFHPERKNIPMTRLGGRSPRYLMQTLGTEWGRNLVCPSVWVDEASRRLAQSTDAINVFADVRFEDEAEWIRGQGGVIVHVQRFSYNALSTDHRSESGIDQHPEDEIILNHGSLEELHDQVTVLAAVLGVTLPILNEDPQ